MRDAGTVVVVVLAQGEILNQNKNMATAVSKPKINFNKFATSSRSGIYRSVRTLKLQIFYC